MRLALLAAISMDAGPPTSAEKQGALGWLSAAQRSAGQQEAGITSRGTLQQRLALRRQGDDAGLGRPARPGHAGLHQPALSEELHRQTDGRLRHLRVEQADVGETHGRRRRRAQQSHDAAATGAQRRRRAERLFPALLHRTLAEGHHGLGQQLGLAELLRLR